MSVDQISTYTLPPAAADGPAAPRWPLWAVYAIATITGLVVVIAGLFKLVPEMPTVALVGTVAFGLYAVLWAWIIGLADTYLPLSRRTKVLAFVWGGVATAGIASLANTPIGVYVAAHMGPEWSAAFGGPFTEEALKSVGIAVVLLLMVPRPRTSLEGLMVGAWVGMGFQVVEDLFLTMADAMTLPVGQRDDLIVIVNSLINRGLLFGWFSHVTFSAIVGFGVGYFFTRRTSAGKRWAVLVGTIFVAWLAHFLWNSPVLGFMGPISMPVQGIPLVVLALYLVKLGRREESALFRPYLGYVDPSVVTPEQIDAMTSPKTRKAARKASGNKKAERAAQRARASLAVAIATADAPAADAEVAALTA